MLTKSQLEVIEELINENLDRAERIWEQVGTELEHEKKALVEEAMMKFESVRSNIPGHSLVSENNPKVETYIALVADMRNSTEHLLDDEITPSNPQKINGLRRVYYETSALLPALAQTIKFESGVITEYLGDGVLSLFLVKKSEIGNPRLSTIFSAHRAACNCIYQTKKLVNLALDQRYGLPPLEIGIGISMSEALVTLVGLKKEKQAKVIGKCVYRATKLSSGADEIYVDRPVRDELIRGHHLSRSHPTPTLIKRVEAFKVPTHPIALILNRLAYLKQLKDRVK